MASLDDSHTKQLQELVTCAICLDHYQDPRVLPCSHTFCFQCIQKTVKNSNFNCPMQDNTNIIEKDIPQLPINQTVKNMTEFLISLNLYTDTGLSQKCINCDENRAINWCNKCDAYYCESCTTSVHSIKALQSHTTIPSAERVQSFCLEHSDERFKYWCKRCETLVCRDCLLLQHRDHKFLSLKDATTEAKTNFQETAREVDKIKRNLTAFSKVTQDLINQQRESVRREKQDIEQTFANLQRMLEERKLTMIKQLEDNESQTTKVLHTHQSTIDQHLNLAIVQELCIKKMLNSNDPMEILKFKSTLSHNYKYFTEQYKKIDEGYSMTSYTFEKDYKDIEQILGIISKLGKINDEIYLVKKDGTVIKTMALDISKIDGEEKSSEKQQNYARGYKFSLKQPFRICSIRIQSDYIGQHVGFVVDDADVVIQTETVNSNDSTMKWLTIPLKCNIKNNYSVLAWAPSGNGSYTYKNGDNKLRTINENCSVVSKRLSSEAEVNVGSTVAVATNRYCIDMILDIEK